jgi:hypothetical protein
MCIISKELSQEFYDVRADVGQQNNAIFRQDPILMQGCAGIYSLPWIRYLPGKKVRIESCTCNPHLLGMIHAVNQSLAGRTALLKLLPFTMAELQTAVPLF